jgi:cyclic beta-1,2-glucan synthetase
LWDDEDPIRGELFSIERLEHHAESLAANQPVIASPTAGKSLVARLVDNERVLLAAYKGMAAAAHLGQPITPAAAASWGYRAGQCRRFGTRHCA